MNVLYLSAIARVIDGPGRSLLQLLRALNGSRIRPLVVVSETGMLTEELTCLGVEWIVVPMPRLSRTRSPTGVARVITNFFQVGSVLASIIRRRKIELVHINEISSLYGGPPARLCRIPTLWHLRWTATEGPFNDLVLRFAGILASVLVAVSEAVRERALRAGISRKKVRLVRNGIDLDEYRPGIDGLEFRRYLGIPDGAPLVGVIGGISPLKGQDVLVRALPLVTRACPEAHAVIVGNPVSDNEQAYFESVKRTRFNLGLEQRLHFVPARKDVRPVFAALDVLAHCPRLPDSSPRVILEAMAMGKPVVGSGIGGIPELITDRWNGLLVHPGDATCLGEAVARVLKDPGLARRMGEHGRLRAQELFSLPAHAAAMEDLYGQMLRGDGCLGGSP